MKGVNKVIFVGTVARVLQISGNTVGSFILLMEEIRKGGIVHSQKHRISYAIAQHQLVIREGQRLHVEGRLSYYDTVTEDGVPVHAPVIWAHVIKEI